MALKGIKVLELSGLAPVPFCGMILADFGASVLRIEKLKESRLPPLDGLSRGKRSMALDISKSEGLRIMKKLTSNYDVLIDPYRPGVLEKLGLGPEVLQTLNPELILARISGYGQTGPLSKKSGHDINYVAMSGLLSVLGTAGKAPFPPINLLADFGGGGLLCAFAICMALFERTKTGKGQIIDNSMTEGAAYLGSFIWRTQHPTSPLEWNIWGKNRGQNVLDGGVAFYQSYRTKDNRYMAVGALEPKFYRDFLKGLELDEDDHFQFGDQNELKKIFSDCFSLKTQSEWVEIFSPLDACVTPVLTLIEASQHSQHLERKAFLSEPGICPAPAPKLYSYSREEKNDQQRLSDNNYREPEVGEDSISVLREIGYQPEEIKQLIENGVLEIYENKSKL